MIRPAEKRRTPSQSKTRAARRLPRWLPLVLAAAVLAAAALGFWLRPRPLAPQGLSRIGLSVYRESLDSAETLGRGTLAAGEPGFDAVAAVLEGQTWRQPFPGCERNARPVGADSTWLTIDLALTDGSGSITWVPLYDDGYLQVLNTSRGFAAGDYSALAGALYAAAAPYLA